jgi:hypothetical protein
VRNLNAVATAFAAFAIFAVSLAAPAQTWMETHPVLIDASSRVQTSDVRAETKTAPVQEARLPADDEPKPDDGAKIGKGPLDHPANASGESSRHE